jgi:uncharacterized membrane protein
MVREKLAQKGVGRAADFRWRSREITRIEGFSDAVFAFAVTLLVVSLEVPRTFDELAGATQGFVAFALGSAILFIIWYSQYKFFRRYGMQDVLTITLNGALLFVVLFFVYPLKFLFTYLIKAFTGADTTVRLANGLIEQAIRPEQTGSLMLIYGLGYVAVFGIFVLMYCHAYRKRTELELSEVERYDTKTSIRENALQMGIGILSVSLVLIGGSAWAFWAGLCYMLIGPVLSVHGALSGRRRRSLVS